MSHFGHLETPGGNPVDFHGASFWGPGGSSGRPLGDLGSTLYSCEGVEVILGTFWNHFGFPKGSKICQNVCPGDLSTEALESSWKSLQNASIFESLDPPKLCEGSPKSRFS